MLIYYIDFTHVTLKAHIQFNFFTVSSSKVQSYFIPLQSHFIAHHELSQCTLCFCPKEGPMSTLAYQVGHDFYIIFRYSIQYNIKYMVTEHILHINLQIKFIYCLSIPRLQFSQNLLQVDASHNARPHLMPVNCYQVGR